MTDAVVIDTCVWVSALTSKSPKGAPRKLLNKLERGRLRPIVSPRLLGELSNTLARKKFRKAISAEDAADFISELRRQGEMVPDVENPPAVTRDPKDDYLAALAEAQNATLVSTDLDRLRSHHVSYSSD